MMRSIGLVAAGALALAAGCAHAPQTTEGRNDLTMAAERSVQQMTANDPGLQALLDRSAGYVVFPKVTQGGFIVGGGAGRGVVFDHGNPIGFAELTQGSVGAEAGGQQYTELIVLRDQYGLDRMRAGNFEVGGQASAVIAHTGAAAATPFSANGVAVFVQPLTGAEINVSLTGQRIKFSG